MFSTTMLLLLLLLLFWYESITGLWKKNLGADDIVLVIVPGVHHHHEGGEQQDKDEVEDEGEEEHVLGSLPASLNKCDNDRMTEDIVGQFSWKTQKIFDQHQVPWIFINQVPVIDLTNKIHCSWMIPRWHCGNRIAH